MDSCLYFGDVVHHRRSPRKHKFGYKLFMPHLFLDELPKVFKGSWFWSAKRPNISWFRRQDYHRPDVPSLEKAVRETMELQLGCKLEGRISMITHLRTFGHLFNPVTFYYCWDEKLEKPVAVMSEITNTPWHERYSKAFMWTGSPNRNDRSNHAFRKEFHVSPFIGMNIAYDWSFDVPGDKMHIDMILREEGEILFTAHLHMQRKVITATRLNWALVRFPFLTLKVTAGIYWHALLLKLKGIHFYKHPKHQTTEISHELSHN
jgi:DUF1365 family protein